MKATKDFEFVLKVLSSCKTKEQIKNELNQLLRELGYWGDKIGVFYERLEDMRETGLNELVAEYLLLEDEDEEELEQDFNGRLCEEEDN